MSKSNKLEIKKKKHLNTEEIANLDVEHIKAELKASQASMKAMKEGHPNQPPKSHKHSYIDANDKIAESNLKDLKTLAKIEKLERQIWSGAEAIEKNQNITTPQEQIDLQKASNQRELDMMISKHFVQKLKSLNIPHVIVDEVNNAVDSVEKEIIINMFAGYKHQFVKLFGDNPYNLKSDDIIADIDEFLINNVSQQRYNQMANNYANNIQQVHQQENQNYNIGNQNRLAQIRKDELNRQNRENQEMGNEETVGKLLQQKHRRNEVLNRIRNLNPDNIENLDNTILNDTIDNNLDNTMIDYHDISDITNVAEEKYEPIDTGNTNKQSNTSLTMFRHDIINNQSVKTNSINVNINGVEFIVNFTNKRVQVIDKDSQSNLEGKKLAKIFGEKPQIIH